MDKSEKRFERDIESFLISGLGGYQQFNGQDKNGNWIHNRSHDLERCIYLDVLVDFISSTQPKEWARYTKYYGVNAPEKLYKRLEDTINNQGLIWTLRNGIEDMGVKLRLCYFKPESSLNETHNELYEKNILGCTRQFRYSDKHNNTIDMVLSLNGIPVVALELKNQLTGQDYQCAINQFKYDRNPKEFAFRLNHRFLVYFAVDLYETWMTTQLKGDKTYFMPFNQGSNGAGNTGGKGNPTNPDGYATAYLWQEVLQKDSLLDLIHKFISYVKEKDEIVVNGKIKSTTKEKLLFPRYHQYDVVNKVLKDVKANGVGYNYLIEHSAGSGKSNSIAWITYRLASLHNDQNEPIFDSIIVVTNRVVLDSQLQDTINSFEHKKGLVEAIDDKKRSRGLAEAINDKKRIIICTIQKFLFAYKEFEKITGRNFAIIIDEAHQGQSGESAKTLKGSLVDKNIVLKDYAETEGISINEIDENDVLVQTILRQGMHKNQSFFAFTATPKGETLELFGRSNPDTNRIEPFHVYSMKQAIEEGFILDVLKNYTTIKEAFQLGKISDDNPELFTGPTSKMLFKYYKKHGHTIEDKTDIIMSNFLENGRKQINGLGKAMVVADSRANAVRYYNKIKDYIASHPSEALGCNVLVAFSGTVNVDGIDYTEYEMNIDSEGNNINTDKKFRKAFRSNEFNIMVVANKYQTGFDEPLLHSMYVDKKLKGVNAVQTLSRLNRTSPNKMSTFVMDFTNTVDDIKDSFQPFYETTYLEGNTDINKVYDLRNKIAGYMLYNYDDVEKYYKLMSSNIGKKQSQDALGKLASLFKPVVDRYNDYPEDERYTIRDYIRKFNSFYSFVTQLIRLNDKDILKEYQYTCNLIKLLPTTKIDLIDIDDKVKLEYASLNETFNGTITLEEEPGIYVPKTDIQQKIPDKKKDTLQSIIDKVNEKFAGDFTDSDRVMIQTIYNKFLNDKDVKKYQEYAKDNSSEMFEKSLFPDKFREIVVQSYLENDESFKKIFSDDSFYQKVMEAMAREFYKSLRK